jgi:hypothetical protein
VTGGGTITKVIKTKTKENKVPKKGTILIKEIMPDARFVEGHHNYTCERCCSKKDVYEFDCMGSPYSWLCYACNCDEMGLSEESADAQVAIDGIKKCRDNLNQGE